MFAKITVALALASLSIPALANRNSADRLAEQMPESAPAGLQPFSSRTIDWQQPPLGCVEEMVPNIPNRPCLDLTQVLEPMKDWPTTIGDPDKQFWYSHRRNLQYCRAKEVMRREDAAPGSQASAEVAWMIVDSVRNSDKKIAGVYEANRLYKVPVHVLTGALFQESLFAELGISDDGGNFSCGLPQINLYGWCLWANQQSTAVKQEMNWPTNVSCSDETYMNLELIRPLYDIAKARLKGTPEYRLMPKHFENIALADVVGRWPAAPANVQSLRLQTIASFLKNCADPYRGIVAKANELKNLYTNFVSPAFKAKDRYAGGARFQRACQASNADDSYPLQSGWLLAVAAYNAGPRAIDALAHYNHWDRAAINNPAIVNDFTPDQIIPSLYWSGRYNPTNDKIEFNGLDGGLRSWIWFKGCVVQRHIARVMQHVTLLPEFFVDTLEAPYGCAKSSFDPSGRLIKTGVPPLRQTSSGQRE